MPFVALDDEFFANPKTTKAGNDGAGVYVRSLSYCAKFLTDGFVPITWASEIARPAVRRKVTDAGFWVGVTGGEHYEYISGSESYAVDIKEPGYFIPDYLAFNPSRAEVLAKRSELSAKRAEAGRKGALKRWQRDGKGDGKPIANAWQTDSPLPLPLKNSLKAVDFPSYEDQRPETASQVKDQINDSLGGAA